MLKFHTLGIQDFCSIEQMTLPIGDYGITLITGRGEGAFPSNGAGKSSIFEAMVWALFGRTVREFDYDDKIIRDDADRVEVVVNLSIEGKAFNVKRSKVRGRGEPMRLSVLDETGEEIFLTGTVIEKSKALERKLRCDFNTFCNTAYFPQEKFTFFTKANDAGKKQVLDQILGTGYFQELEKRAKDLKKEATLELRQHTNEIEILNVKLETQETEVARIQGELDAVADRTAKEEQSLRQELDQLMRAQTDVLQKKKDCEKRKGKLNVQITEAKELDRQAQAIREKLAARMADHSAKVSRLEEAKEEYAKAVTASKGYIRLLNSGRCPTCKQKFVDSESLAEISQSLHAKLEEAERVVISCTKLAEEADAQYTLVETKYKQLPKGDTKSLSDALQDIEDEAREIEQELGTVTGNISGRQRALDRLDQLMKEQVERWDAQLVLAKETLDKTKLRRDVAKEEVAEVEKHISRLDFWIDGFGPKGMRSLIFENMLPFINERANLYCSRLTDGTIRVEITATTQLKDGDLREKISVSAINDQGASVYGGNSGGERKRIDLAILLALQDLIASRSGAAVQLAVYDEILDQLDEGGIQRVVDLFQEMAKTKPIFVISHSEWLTGFFEDRLTIEKRDGISRLSND